MKDGLVSIVMPVYNAQHYIEKSIQSVLEQTYKTFELIVVNDGSTDQTLEIIEKFNDPRLSVYTVKNGGPSAARNYGLNKADGEYIQFMDADDRLENHATYTLVDNISDSDLVVSSYRILDGEKERTVRVDPLGLYSREDIGKMYLKLFETQVIRHLWNKLYKKDIIDKNTIRFKEGINRGEGILFNLEYLAHIENGSLIDTVFYNYYDNEDSLTSSYIPSYVEDTELVFSKIEQFLIESGIDQDKIKELDDAFVDRLMSYISVLFNPGNKLTYGQIYKEIKHISGNQKFQANICAFRPSTKKMALLKRLFKKRWNVLIFSLYFLNTKL